MARYTNDEFHELIYEIRDLLSDEDYKHAIQLIKELEDSILIRIITDERKIGEMNVRK